MELPMDEWGSLDTQEIEHLLTVYEYLTLLFIASLPQKTLLQPGASPHLNHRRSINKLLDWGLLTAKAAPQPGQPKRHSLTLTPNGELLAARYASESNRLVARRAEHLATLPPVA